MKTYGGVKVQFYHSWSLQLDGDKSSASRPRPSYSRGNSSRNPLDRRLGGLQSRSGHRTEKLPGIENGPSSRQPVVTPTLGTDRSGRVTHYDSFYATFSRFVNPSSIAANAFQHAHTPRVNPSFRLLSSAYEITLCVSMYPSYFLTPGIVEPEETAVAMPYKHVCDMTSERQNSRARRDRLLRYHTNMWHYFWKLE
jgi:hypothetical protein